MAETGENRAETGEKGKKKPFDAARKTGLAQGKPRILLRTFGWPMDTL